MGIDRIYNLGDDALTNLWDMSIGTIPFLNDVETTILRITDFTIPGTGVGTYEVNYKTQQFTKPGGKVEAPNEFSFDFRVDRNWLIYKAFVAWKNAVMNNYTGVRGTDAAGSPTRVEVSVWPVAGEDIGNPISGVGLWRFEGCFVQDIGDVSLDYGSGDPVTVSVTMGFFRMQDAL